MVLNVGDGDGDLTTVKVLFVKLWSVSHHSYENTAVSKVMAENVWWDEEHEQSDKPIWKRTQW